MSLSRRGLLATGLGSLAMLPMACASARAGANKFNSVPSIDDLSPLEVFVRMRCSPPGQTTTWWYSGHMLARMGDEVAMPIMSVIGASQSQAVHLPNGDVRYKLIEAGYYGDPDTGEIAEGEMINRLTGEPMVPQHYLSSQTLRFQKDGVIRPDQDMLPTGVTYTGRMIGPDIKADRVWTGEELFVKIAGSEGAPDRIMTSLANFQSAVADVKAGGSFVPASFEYTTWNSFRPWMNMGTTPGAIMMRLNSVKLPDWSGLPETLRSRIEADHPGAFFDV